MITENLSTPDTLSQRREGLQISEEHRVSLQRTLRIANLVGKGLLIHVVEDENEIPDVPGAYLIEGAVDTEDYQEIVQTDFEFKRVTLSGKADSAHAVLPGILRVHYLGKNNDKVIELDVAAKGCYKRTFEDNLDRVRREIHFSRELEDDGEIAFRPVAVVIAEPPTRGKGTDFNNYDVLLVTRLESAITTLDNVPWQKGLTETNVDTAEAAISALARFNTKNGYHKDSKIKNFAQNPIGKMSMIDFERSQAVDMKDPVEVTAMAHGDVGMFLDSIVNRGFFSQEPYKAHDVIRNLAETYLGHWTGSPDFIQDAVYAAVTEVSEQCYRDVVRRAHLNSLAKAALIT